MRSPQKIIAIDPGTVHVGWVELVRDRDAWRVAWAAEHSPRVARDMARTAFPDLVLIEGVTNYGSMVGRDVFGTCILIGRIVELFLGRAPIYMVFRPHVRCTLGGSMRARDSDVKNAIRAAFGDRPKGTARDPGPLFMVRGHAWSALAVAMAYLADPTPAPLKIEPILEDF